MNERATSPWSVRVQPRTALFTPRHLEEEVSLQEELEELGSGKIHKEVLGTKHFGLAKGLGGEVDQQLNYRRGAGFSKVHNDED